MVLRDEDGMRFADLFWDDLSESTQKELYDVMGDNGNYDVFPLATINVSGEPDETQDSEE